MVFLILLLGGWEVEKKQLEKMLNELTVEGIHVVDSDGTTLLYNDIMAELEGLDREEVLNKKILDVLPSLKGQSTLMHVLSTKEPILNNLQTYFNKEGKEISTINSTWPIKREGKIWGAVEIARDVTQISKLAQKVMEPQNHGQNINPKNKVKSIKYSFEDILGNSSEILHAKQIAKMASKSSSNVLIIGESGTGKELFAQGIHVASSRKNQPFIAENCAAIPESLLEGLLFGTTKGGFTGAVDRAGLYQQAHGGTLLLDEINAMPMGLQSKLLRAIQEGKIRPVGGTNEVQVDVRIIAIINEDPLKAIEEGRLRKDLFFRLSVINIFIPPLRERKEDIELLTEYFIDKFSKENNKNIEGIDKEIEKFFQTYGWPGNVRELEHVLEGSINLVREGELIQQRHLPYYAQRSIDMPPHEATDKGEKEKTISLEELTDKNIDLDKCLTDIEDSLIKEALRVNEGNITKAAKNLGISRQRLQHKLKKRFLKEYINKS
ncbi:MAG: sigma 54-interacting transcriptional regulator [Clostridiaceae bacterium]|nr:sigma 54-interacting transcriptional regulator [Clostridiaceae bacterium]